MLPVLGAAGMQRQRPLAPLRQFAGRLISTFSRHWMELLEADAPESVGSAEIMGFWLKCRPDFYARTA